MAKTKSNNRRTKTSTRRRRGGLSFGKYNFGNLREMAGNQLNKMTDGKISGDVFTKDRGMATKAAAMGAQAQQMASDGMAAAKASMSPGPSPADAAARGGRRRRRSRKNKKSKKAKKSKKHHKKSRRGRRRH